MRLDEFFAVLRTSSTTQGQDENKASRRMKGCYSRFWWKWRHLGTVWDDEHFTNGVMRTRGKNEMRVRDEDL